MSRSDARQKMLREEIKAIEDKYGRAIPKTVVDVARDVGHPLHDEFEWDDTVAAQLQREGRARELIREVRVTVIHGEKRIAAPVYVSDPRTPESSYIRTISIAKSTTSKRQVLQLEIDRIASAIQRAMAIAIVFKLERRFENALNEIMQAAVELGELDDDDSDDDGDTTAPEGSRPTP